MTHYVLIDGNNVIFASQLAGMGKNPKTKRLWAGDVETTAIYGALTSLRTLKTRYMDATLLVLWDTGKAWRYDVYPEYKGNRKDNPDIVAAKEALKPQRPVVVQMLELLGIPQVTAENYEADDIAAFLADGLSKRGHKVTLVTRDRDWLQMVRPGVSWYDREADRSISHVTFEAEVGTSSPDAYSEVKVLQGDTGDNVKGIYKVGEAGANAIIEAFGTVEGFLEGWEEYVADGKLVTGHPLKRALKPIQAFLADADAARAHMDLNRKLMDLRTMYGNKDLGQAIRKSRAAFDLEALKPLLARYSFLSILKDATRWSAPFDTAQ